MSTPQNGSADNFPQGECTYWASYRFHQLTGYYVPWPGDAHQWADNAAQYGWTNSTTPSVPSIICFQPGVEQADPVYGHVGVVESLNSDGSVHTSNLNYGTTEAQRSVVQQINFKPGQGVSFITAVQGASGGNDVQVTIKDFCTAVVNRLRNDKGTINVLGAGPSQKIINFMIAWCLQEGGAVKNACSWNPLNTTQTEQGSTQCQGVMPGIQAYGTQGVGEDATAHTIENGHYGSLWNALATNDEGNLGFTGQGMAENVASNLAIWMSGSSAIKPTAYSYIINIMADAGIDKPFIRGVGTQSSAPGATQQQIDAWGSQVIGSYSSSQNLANNIGGPNLPDLVSAANTFISNINSFFQNPVRLVEILGGAALIIAGLVLLIGTFASSPGVQKVAKTAAIVGG